MNDADWIKEIKKVDTVYDILKIIVENQTFFGHDPYYVELKRAMLDQAIDILAGGPDEVME